MRPGAVVNTCNWETEIWKCPVQGQPGSKKSKTSPQPINYMFVPLILAIQEA
jgi:hypothetical protein